ncbi:hypothetical protein M1N64_01335 [Peptococcaceae bacterium]|nr:hypothetical protein [Peptococcaceae bacterium]
MSELLTINEASEWATRFLNKKVTPSNISYLIQYGRIRKDKSNGRTVVDISDLKKYYKSQFKTKEESWKELLGDDLNWTLSFSEYKETETTKHVHRLHPYKGKFIPQLVEYFLDKHTDSFKKEIYFQKGDVVLDPFCGSGTTLVQANELGIHAIGLDISAFNTLISNVKIQKYDILNIEQTLWEITNSLKAFQQDKSNVKFEKQLLYELNLFNTKYFPSPDFKRQVRLKEINEIAYSKEKEKEFLVIYAGLIKQYRIFLKQNKNDNFLDKWFLQPVRDEIDFVYEQVRKIDNEKTKRVIAVILSRTIRSCRATTHSDLGTLKTPVTTTYYCKKHGKICKPLFSIYSWWERYGKDTIQRLKQFEKLKTGTRQICLTGDSRTTNIFSKLKQININFGKFIEEKKIKGIFSSPPYVGLINYHQQHEYSYDLFGFERADGLEIGPLSKGQGKEARDAYSISIADVLINCKKYLQEDYDIFLVANDKYNLYPQIAEKAGMQIVNRYKRPVLNRVEKTRFAYAEIIFHLKEQ